MRHSRIGTKQTNARIVAIVISTSEAANSPLHPNHTKVTSSTSVSKEAIGTHTRCEANNLRLLENVQVSAE